MRLFARRPRAPRELRRFDEAIAGIRAEVAHGRSWEFRPGESEHAAELLELDRSEQPDAIVAVLIEAGRVDRDDWHGTSALNAVASQMLRRKLEWDDGRLDAMLDALTRQRSWDGRLRSWGTPLSAALGAIEKRHASQPIGPEVRDRLERIRVGLLDGHADADDRKAVHRIDALVGDPDEQPLLGADPWASAIRDVAIATPTDLADAAIGLAVTARSASVTAKFERTAEELVEQHGVEAVDELVGDALSAVAAVRGTEDTGQIPPETGDVVRGLAWIGAVAGGSRALRGMGDVAVAGWRKIPNYGPLSAKAANACIASLARVPDGAPQLGRVRVFLKQAQAVERIEAAIDDAAERLGIPRDQFVERVVPDMGLEDGVRKVQFGEHTAELRLEPDGSARLVFRKPDGREMKSVPKAVREEFPAELKALRQEVKDLKAMASAQRARVERLLIDERDWSFEDWRRYYGDHGLVGPLVRRLIWEIDAEGTDDWHGWVEAVDGRPDAPGEAARVRLWHPAAASAEEVQGWRERLEAAEIQQPFKQAHREIYLLTDAERETRTYSNRFAAHVLKQHQLSALCRARGWRYSLQGAWDSEEVEAVLDLPQHGLKVAFWVERPWEQAEGQWDDMIAESGVFTVVTTDQVRFVDPDNAAEPRPLEDVPPRVFSEAMRDVDLFVGVCSIGNDPTWTDQAEARPFQRYWDAFAFGDLGDQAVTRREVLERLLPKLALRDAATVDGRFLRVQGKRRAYKIHLGSGNILMEPNDEYLCIVAGRDKAAEKVFLPFEGDRGLALILSKAFLLAADDEITDATINSQIGARR